LNAVCKKEEAFEFVVGSVEVVGMESCWEAIAWVIFQTLRPSTYLPLIAVLLQYDPNAIFLTNNTTVVVWVGLLPPT